MNRFPFSVVFVARDKDIIVLALAHHRRRPDYWRERVRNATRCPIHACAPFLGDIHLVARRRPADPRHPRDRRRAPQTTENDSIT
jgi:hypothetical protein